MILVFTSASLWGCLGFDKFLGEMPAQSSLRGHMLLLLNQSKDTFQLLTSMLFKQDFNLMGTNSLPDFVINMTLTQTLTLVLNAVSAFCWGSFADFCIIRCVSVIGKLNKK